MELNEHRKWDGDVADIVTDSSNLNKPTVKKAFLHGLASHDRIKAGEQLYKFNDWPSLAPGDPATEAYRTQIISPWWSPYLPYKADPGWVQRLAMAKHFGVSIRELGRLTSVIRENWNSLSYLAIITLKEPVWGFYGGFQGMARKDLLRKSKQVVNGSQVAEKHRAGFKAEGSSGSKNLPGGGGASQFYIPSLTPSHVSEVLILPLFDK
jgi:hypothetical protein